jgi:hypothetical protein
MKQNDQMNKLEKSWKHQYELTAKSILIYSYEIYKQLSALWINISINASWVDCMTTVFFFI